MLGFGGVGLLALAIYYAIDTEKNWVRILSWFYIVAANLSALYRCIEERNEIYLILPLFSLLLWGVIHTIYKALD